MLALAAAASAATRFDPALRFRTLPTEHFVIYFHRGEERMAQRLAAIAEETWRALRQPLGVTAPARTHVVLADQTELANGYATPLPYNTIVIYSVWPSGSDFVFDDWLRLLFTHEFTHIVHLDRSEGWARRVRAVFGRVPIVFPNMFLPAWQIEGLATYEESASTGVGRLHAGDFRAIVDEAARARSLEPLDRVAGTVTDWPGSAAPYAYGVGFHQYLADTYGPGTLATLATATARRVPYTGSRAFKRVYGRSLGTLWRDYQASLETAGRADASAAPLLVPTRVTHHGFSVRGPRFDRFACAGCTPDILYSASNPDGFPALYRVEAAGGEPQQLATRYLGSTTGVGRDAVYFDQLEIRRHVGLFSDLYEWSRADGRVRRLTRDARLLDPDLSPDGTALVCVQDRGGQRDLVTVRLSASARRASSPSRGSAARIGPSEVGKADTAYELTVLASEADTQFDAPKWSPDGRRIAVERHRLGAMPEIVVVDVATRAVLVVAAGANTRFVMPAWRPDGAALVAAAAPDDRTFNLVEIAIDGSATRQLTHTTGGATWPDVSPDGRTIAFVGYTTDGYDVFTMPYPADVGPSFQGGHVDGDDLAGETQRAKPAETVALGSLADTADYSPLSTLKPTSWFPVVEADGDQIRAGGSVAGVDVLGYHAYAASATWLLRAPEDVATPHAASPDWQVYYAYDRWLPTFYGALSSQTSFFAGPATDAGTPATATRRERQLEGGVVWPIQRVRVRHAALVAIVRSVDEFTLPNGAFSRLRTPLHAAWRTVTGRTYGYSISREDGVAAGATAEIVRRRLGSFADATILTGDARAYFPGLARHHVTAVRAAGGLSHGDATAGRTFRLGGGHAAEDVADFSSDAFALLRGFGRDAFAGTRVAIVNAEYRWPIARPQRGVGTWPLFLHSIHGAVFADAGHAWTRTFQSSAIKTAAGAQISADVIAGYFAPLTLTAGVAWGRDRARFNSDRVTTYFRVGRAF
jgi:hypothetical protein